MKVIILDTALERGAAADVPGIDATTERHRLELPATGGGAAVIGDVLAWLSTHPEVRGAVLPVPTGYAGRQHLALAGRLLRAGYAAWFYWPPEQALERVDDERLRSGWRHWIAVKGWEAARRLTGRPAWTPPAAAERPAAPAEISSDVDALVSAASPVPFAGRRVPSPASPLPGTGVYLRTDYWAPITSGGSYVHTCFVAKELARVTGGFVALMANRYPLLDDLGLRQVVLERPGASAGELDLLRATGHYEARLRPVLEALKPAYLYERLCLGNYAGARLSQALDIPYIVEYNGSELSMRRSFQGDRFVYEQEFERIEQAAFAQATLISVVSEIVRDDLLKRGVPADKIVVNPNGVDPDTYAPASAEQRAELRRELGWSDRERVVCFTGTFGGWHGVDVLAAAMPRIASQSPDVRFLLIGDGTHKHLVDTAVRDGGLAARVHAPGRVPQPEGARLLKAADIFVSPHSSHMVDSRFFGSPTKLFEYMACGGGIVASDLEQIGQVLQPALRPGDFAGGAPAVGRERAVLCEPGNVDDFVRAVCALAAYPAIARALGANARAAAQVDFSWEAHVRRLWSAAAGEIQPVPAAAPAQPARIETGDPYKDQVQNQWNNNPVGSQYVKHAQAHTLQWFLEVEAHRYGEYGPWMPEVMEFDRHAGKRLLEIGGGMGTDLAQFARHGAIVTDLDLSAGHLALAQENFRLRGLPGTFIHQDAETLPFPDASFDVVYSNGVIHHTPNTQSVVDEIYRVLAPGGRAIIMVYAENSLHYWGVQVGLLGLRGGLLQSASMGDIMSRSVEMTKNDARPLVKVYTARRLRAMFSRFTDVQIVKRQLTAPELPPFARWVPLGLAGRLVGWNLIVKATKPLDASRARSA
ncbi:MAG TPA: methyltransferase domain-containing protein [Vicinamibacterales bacterium]|nr:methyltransferase domain-containing protein [Vicinamibacterales bacterium]